MRIREFVDSSGIEVEKLEAVERNPNLFLDEKWQAYHYRIVLRRGKGRDKRRMTVYFSTGIGWHRQPDVYDVFETLYSDALYMSHSNGFIEFCRECGYTDVSNARKVYDALLREVKKLRKFLGEAYDVLLACVDEEA